MTDSGRQEDMKDLTKTFLICVVGFLGFYFLHYFARNELKIPFVIEVFLHISIAFLIAGIITVTVEYNARRRDSRETQDFAESIADNVFTGLLKHIVPEAIFAEINSLLRSDHVRKNCEYIITFSQEGAPEGQVVVQRELQFDVENLKNDLMTFPVRSTFLAEPGAEDGQGLTFHATLVIDNSQPIDVSSYIKTEAGISRLYYPLPLEPRQTATVYLAGQTLYPLGPGTISFTQGTAVIGMKVEINNLCPKIIHDIDVVMHHPASDEVIRNTLGRYVLHRAFLPGQGFELRWSPTREASENAGAIEEITSAP